MDGIRDFETTFFTADFTLHKEVNMKLFNRDPCFKLSMEFWLRLDNNYERSAEPELKIEMMTHDA